MDLSLYGILELLGIIVRALGAVVFGVATGWLTARSVKWHAGSWQYGAAAFLGLLGAFALIGHWVDGAATLGGFGLGAGAGILIWGMGRES